MRILIAILVTALLLAVAIVALAPAGLVDFETKKLTAGNVRLAQSSGTLWKGSGDLVLTAADARVPLAWTIEPWPLLHGEVAGTIGTGAGGASGTFSVRRDGFSLRDIHLALPATAIMRASGSPAMLAAVGGTIDVQVNTLSKNGDQLDGRFTARWQNASLPGPRPEARIGLGDVRVDVAGTGAELPGTVGNVGGDVELSGTVALSTTAARISAVVRPRAGVDSERSQAIEAALRVVGQPDGSGGFRVAWTAPLK
jgi:general secretion pathway protein N